MAGLTLHQGCCTVNDVVGEMTDSVYMVVSDISTGSLIR
jgi:hypothetical protein